MTKQREISKAIKRSRTMGEFDREFDRTGKQYVEFLLCELCGFLH